MGREEKDATSPTQKIDYVLDLTRQYANLLQVAEGTHIKDYTWDFDVISETGDGSSRFYLQDEMRSPIRLVDTSGTLESYAYDEFGQDLAADPNTQPFGYTGYLPDPVSGTYFAQNREYLASLGRFVSEDSIQSGSNWYTYCENNPVMFIDPLGLASVFQPSSEYWPQAPSSPTAAELPGKIKLDNVDNLLIGTVFGADIIVEGPKVEGYNTVQTTNVASGIFIGTTTVKPLSCEKEYGGKVNTPAARVGSVDYSTSLSISGGTVKYSFLSINNQTNSDKKDVTVGSIGISSKGMFVSTGAGSKIGDVTTLNVFSQDIDQRNKVLLPVICRDDFNMGTKIRADIEALKKTGEFVAPSKCPQSSRCSG